MPTYRSLTQYSANINIWEPNDSNSDLCVIIIVYGMSVIRTSHLCGMKPVITPQTMPTQTPMATSMGPRIAFVSQLPECEGKNKHQINNGYSVSSALALRNNTIRVIPSENMILRQTPNAEMQNMSSKLHAAITNVMIPLSSPRPFCLKSNSAGRITAELTGLKMHLWWAEEVSEFVGKN